METIKTWIKYWMFRSEFFQNELHSSWSEGYEDGRKDGIEESTDRFRHFLVEVEKSNV